MENLLYYPYINIPNADWTARALLYYDKIGAIVPQRYFFKEYEPHMKELVSNRLIEAINPLTVLDNPWEVGNPFLQYLSNSDFDLEIKVQSFLNNNVSRIHADKFDQAIFYELECMGLASRQNDYWYCVEQNTANDLMTFLAFVIGAKLNYQPTTDDQSFIPENLEMNVENYEMVERKRRLILNELIPFPENIDIKKIRKFKDEHLEPLKAFKNKVELIALNPSIQEDTLFFKESIAELRFRKEELSAKMREDNLGKIFFGSVCGILGAIVSLKGLETLKDAGLAFPAFANAIYSALQLEKPENIFDQSGMKYLALIDRKLTK